MHQTCLLTLVGPVFLEIQNLTGIEFAKCIGQAIVFSNHENVNLIGGMAHPK